jgi:hypothetical protein
MKRLILGITILLVLPCLSVSAAPSAEQQGQVIGTTGWTAAFAQTAGADSVRVLAPYEMRHPAEYELRPSDIDAVAGAKLIVFAGYETMVEKLKSAAGNAEVEVLQIDTRNDLVTIRASVTKIAAALGTTEEAAKNLSEIESFFEQWEKEIQELGLAGAPALVHTHQRPLAAELGFVIEGVFGPGPLEPAQLVELSAKEAKLIIDNWHNQIASPLKESLSEAALVSFINFPGALETHSLHDVLEHNRAALVEAVEDEK